VVLDKYFKSVFVGGGVPQIEIFTMAQGENECKQRKTYLESLIWAVEASWVVFRSNAVGAGSPVAARRKANDILITPLFDALLLAPCVLLCAIVSLLIRLCFSTRQT